MGVNILVIKNKQHLQGIFGAMDGTVRHFKVHDKAKAINKRNQLVENIYWEEYLKHLC